MNKDTQNIPTFSKHWLLKLSQSFENVTNLESAPLESPSDYVLIYMYMCIYMCVYMCMYIDIFLSLYT